VLAGLLGAMLAARSDEALADPAAPARIAAEAALIHGLAAESASNGGPVAALAVAQAIPAAIADLLG
jgi:NAD(P)H-hydrate repair Nnr-like enzyme with NAD(P)H-hydrate dehydratase domain